MSKRIVVMAGGTGGHIFPALAVAEHLRKQGWEVSWVGTKKGMESHIIPEYNIEIDWLSVNGLRGKNFFALFKMPWMLLKACLEARKILQQRQPDVVLGMGGFVSGPGGLMAKMLGIPLIIHEQNKIPGTTNRLLAKIADQVLQAFPHSFAINQKAIFTGNPLRESFVQVKASTSTPKDVLHILVMGGSLGAQRLNDIVPEALALLSDVDVQHQTGGAMKRQVSAAYKDKLVNANVSAFIDDVVAAYQWADLVICRAGAMTVSEIAAMGLPSILVPYPYAIDDHQTANANYLVEAGASFLINQKELSAVFLAEKVRDCMTQLETMAIAAKKSARLNATMSVAEQCILVAT